MRQLVRELAEAYGIFSLEFLDGIFITIESVHHHISDQIPEKHDIRVIQTNIRNTNHPNRFQICTNRWSVVRLLAIAIITSDHPRDVNP